jgi:predicted O-methyltransferase YrrM
MPAVCLNMIVKNEGAVIERCLKAVLPYIDSWCIVDTGSTDDTKEKIARILGDLPGELHERPWIDFAHNRTEAIGIAQDWKGDADYLLFLDADDVWTAQAGFEFPELEGDAYYVKLQLGDLSYRRVVLARADLPWRYDNAVHEAINCGQAFVGTTLERVRIDCRQDGARRAEIVPAEKYAADAAALEAVVAAEPGNLRAMFYLAQSYRDAGETLKAAEWYRKRSEAGGWVEEQWYATLQLAHLLAAMGAPWQTTQATYESAYRLRPTRSEPLVALSAHLRGRGEFAQAHVYACAAVDTLYPEDDLLFVDEPTYEWRALDEYAITAFYVGKRRQAVEANQTLLNVAPRDHHERIRTNLAFCRGDEHKGAPLDPAVREAAAGHRERLTELHRLYVTTVSTEAMAASLEACALVYALCEVGKVAQVLDLGSGLSSAVLRAGPWQVHSVDHDAAWLDKTGVFLGEQNLEDVFLYTAAEFFETPATARYNLAFMDLGHTPERADHLSAVWERLRPGGLMVIDDIHHVVYRARVQEWLETVDHHQIDVHRETLDRFGRYAWLVRKAE